ncbi:MAG: TraB/GumN family protein [Acidobacteria bacterium]|nr:TraB/GumN family protein [Acidobacteriota bacterium]
MFSTLRTRIILSTTVLLGGMVFLQAASAGDPGPLFFWTVRSQSATVHLLGSLHVGTEDMYPLDSTIEEAFADSSSLVVEIDLDEQAQARAQRLGLEKGIYTDGTTLRDHLTPETFSLLENYLSDRELPGVRFFGMKPWFVVQTLTLMEIALLGYDPSLGIDQHFLRQAREAGKRIEEFESIDSQIGLLAGFSDELQELTLIHALRENEGVQRELEQVFEAWRNGDPEALDRLMREDLKEDARLRPVYERLFDERNARMVSRIREFLGTQGTYFVVVGAGHIVGEQGILNLLERQGSNAYSIHQHARAASASDTPGARSYPSLTALQSYGYDHF